MNIDERPASGAVTWRERAYEWAEETVEGGASGVILQETAEAVAQTLLALREQHSKSGGSVCEWTPYYEEDDPATAGYMQSGCPDEHGRAHEWMDSEGDPPGRWMKFCPFCGGKTAFVAQESEPPKPGGLP